MTVMIQCDNCFNYGVYGSESESYLKVEFTKGMKSVTKQFCSVCSKNVLSIMGIRMEDAITGGESE